MKKYITVYDYTLQGGERFEFFPIIFFFIGIGVFYYNYKKSGKIKNFKGIFSIIFIAFSLLLSILFTSQYIQSKKNVEKAIENKDYHITEGVIENFVPMPKEGHSFENFTVKGTWFQYSDYSPIEGFHNAKSLGGPIQGNGQYVRVTYYAPYGLNMIIKLEVGKTQ